MKPQDEIIKLRKDLDTAQKRAEDIIISSNKVHEALMEKLSDLQKEIADIRVDIASLPDELLKRFDERYATKESQWAEPLLKWLGIIVGAGILGYFGTIIIKVIEM